MTITVGAQPLLDGLAPQSRRSAPLSLQQAMAQLADTCPGLQSSRDDLLNMRTESASVQGFEGGTDLNFVVADRPKAMPDSVALRAARHSCSISISKDRTCAEIGKRACYAVCTGLWSDARPPKIDLIPEGCSPAKPVALATVRTLNIQVVTKGLPLVGREETTSINGRRKITWESIEGIEYSSFEVIGDRPDDLDEVAWQCQEFEATGNTRAVTDPSASCHRFFVQVLAGLVDQPDAVAANLLRRSGREGTTVSHDLQVFRIETNGIFFFLRRR